MIIDSTNQFSCIPKHIFFLYDKTLVSIVFTLNNHYKYILTILY